MKTYLLPFLILCTLTASAQRKGLAVYFKTGSGYTGIATYNGPTDEYARGISNLHLNFTIGTGYMFNDYFGLFSGVGLTACFWEHSNYYTGNKTQDYHQEQDFIEIPVYIRAITSRAATTGFFADIGYKICILNGAGNNLHDEADPYPGINNTHMNADNILDFNQTTLAAYTHFGLNCALGNRGTLLLGPDIQYQLSNNFNYGNLKGHLISVGFKLGLNVQLTPWHHLQLKKHK